MKLCLEVEEMDTAYFHFPELSISFTRPLYNINLRCILYQLCLANSSTLRQTAMYIQTLPSSSSGDASKQSKHISLLKCIFKDSLYFSSLVSYIQPLFHICFCCILPHLPLNVRNLLPSISNTSILNYYMSLTSTLTLVF